jgi:hypothetical protein
LAGPRNRRNRRWVRTQGWGGREATKPRGGPFQLTIREVLNPSSVASTVAGSSRMRSGLYRHNQKLVRRVIRVVKRPLVASNHTPPSRVWMSALLCPLSIIFWAGWSRPLGTSANHNPRLAPVDWRRTLEGRTMPWVWWVTAAFLFRLTTSASDRKGKAEVCTERHGALGGPDGRRTPRSSPATRNGTETNP